MNVIVQHSTGLLESFATVEDAVVALKEVYGEEIVTSWPPVETLKVDQTCYIYNDSTEFLKDHFGQPRTHAVARIIR